VGVALLCALAVLVVLVWGSSSGAPLVTEPQGTWGPPRASVGEPTGLPTPEPDATAEPAGDEPAARSVEWLVDLVTALFLVSVLTAVLLLLRWLSRQRLEEKDRRTTVEEDELVALLEATGDEVRWQALSEGDPRNGVVACWVALEEAVGRAGLRQSRSETAAELTARVLARYEVDATAITDLSDAYREARFSRHPVTEEQRDAAVDALERIHADLRRRVQAEEEARAAEERSREAARLAREDAEAQAAERTGGRTTALRPGRRR
jgi:hypothetical protein